MVPPDRGLRTSTGVTGSRLEMGVCGEAVLCVLCDDHESERRRSGVRGEKAGGDCQLCCEEYEPVRVMVVARLELRECGTNGVREGRTGGSLRSETLRPVQSIPSIFCGGSGELDCNRRGMISKAFRYAERAGKCPD